MISGDYLLMIFFFFTIKDTKLYYPVTLSANQNRKLSKLLSKGNERSVYWNELKTKCEIENMANKYRYFLESKFAGVSRLFVLAYSNQDNAFKKVLKYKILYTKMHYQVL